VRVNETPKLRRRPDPAEVLGYMTALSNWGRWGPDDELGTLNLISREKRVEAAQLVREGITVGCARQLAREAQSPDVPHQPQQFMLSSGESAGAPYAQEYVGLVFHSLTVSHIDAVSHYFWEDKMYNGKPRSAVSSVEGATYCSVDALRDGVVTRGVLLDIPRLVDRPFLDPGEAVFPEDLEEAEAAQGVKVTEGDALLLRTGWSRRRAEGDPAARTASRPGFHAACLPWLHRRGIALVAADAVQDVVPSGYERPDRPIHIVGLVAMGLPMLDACQFEDLARTSEQLRRWDFLFVVAPLRLSHATGSPVTPIAVF
jgi:kynurenine formamidase